ncbi:hypothetical protein Sango_0325700 [Sesamum angolense]|uniref:Saccharopine dehydrogenase NADP binding domain-containing protein n=1 Tax=Sesamum angolense TaxID=2727404 RepID=A0AAE2C3A1_9LAMI|nr:hypothetical protein Sango_0325700 [Sesamum angolense]
MAVGFVKASSSTAEIRKETGDHHRVERVDVSRLPPAEEVIRNRSVLIVGGTGVAGSNTAVALNKLCPHLHVVVGGRNRNNFADVDLVINAAGPFDYMECNVLEAAIQSKTAYIDVSDSKRYAQRAKSYKNKAMAAVMAAVLVHNAQSESRDSVEALIFIFFLVLSFAFSYLVFSFPRFNYYTCGSGGAGRGVLATSYFLLGDDAVTYHKGEKVKFSPYSSMLNIDFGEGIGKQDVFLLNLPEVESAHEVLQVPTVSGRFGTGPFFWNWTLSAITRLVPTNFLRDQRIVEMLVQLSYPLIRAVDVITGEIMSIKVDLECSDGYTTTAIFSHKRLSEYIPISHSSGFSLMMTVINHLTFDSNLAAGVATAAFALAVLEGSTKPGVWYPEEPEGISIEARETLLRRVADGAINSVITKSFCRRK